MKIIRTLILFRNTEKKPSKILETQQSVKMSHNIITSKKNTVKLNIGNKTVKKAFENTEDSKITLENTHKMPRSHDKVAIKSSTNWKEKRI